MLDLSLSLPPPRRAHERPPPHPHRMHPNYGHGHHIHVPQTMSSHPRQPDQRATWSVTCLVCLTDCCFLLAFLTHSFPNPVLGDPPSFHVFGPSQLPGRQCTVFARRGAEIGQKRGLSARHCVNLLARAIVMMPVWSGLQGAGDRGRSDLSPIPLRAPPPPSLPPAAQAAPLPHPVCGECPAVSHTLFALLQEEPKTRIVIGELRLFSPQSQVLLHHTRL